MPVAADRLNLSWNTIMAKHVVLVVDDSEDDLSLYKTAVRDSGNDIDLRLIGYGGEAIRYLKG